MIAVLGAKMCAAGDTLAIEESGIDSDFRPDQVPVTWRDGDESVDRHVTPGERVQGAEATVSFEGDIVVKRRSPRTYRHAALDERLRRERTREEARLTSEARRSGVPTPVIRDIDTLETTLTLQHVGDCDLREALTETNVRAVARQLARIHDAGVVHGDPTTRNVRVSREGTIDVFLIDFGLGYYTDHPEDHAMDLHVFAQSLAGTADDADTLVTAAKDAYREVGDERVLARLTDIEGRGRYQ
jgi:N6-L-threonylcarbamoyladenine synthase/protein kinase Bud32